MGRIRGLGWPGSAGLQPEPWSAPTRCDPKTEAGSGASGASSHGAAGMFAVSIVSVLFFLLATGPPLPPLAAIAFGVPLLASIPTAASIVFAVRVWKRGEGRMVGRLFYSLTSVAFCVLLWQMSVWNILPWKV